MTNCGLFQYSNSIIPIALRIKILGVEEKRYRYNTEALQSWIWSTNLNEWGILSLIYVAMYFLVMCTEKA